jgi:hypothetical protein
MTDSAKIILETLLLIDEQSDAALNTAAERFGVRDLNGFAWRIRDLLPNLTADELAKLAKVFTRMETVASSFCGGSTSQVHILIDALDRRDPELAEELLAWAFHSTKNPYVPFGTRGVMRDVANSVSAYRRLTRERNAQTAAAEQQRTEEAKRRKEARAADHGARIADHDKDNAERQARIELLSRITDPIERLEAVANDMETPPYIYPEEWADVVPADLGRLNPATLSALAERLTRTPKGRWRNLRRMLTSMG